MFLITPIANAIGKFYNKIKSFFINLFKKSDEPDKQNIKTPPLIMLEQQQERSEHTERLRSDMQSQLKRMQTHMQMRNDTLRELHWRSKGHARTKQAEKRLKSCLKESKSKGKLGRKNGKHVQFNLSYQAPASNDGQIQTINSRYRFNKPSSGKLLIDQQALSEHSKRTIIDENSPWGKVAKKRKAKHQKRSKNKRRSVIKKAEQKRKSKISIFTSPFKMVKKHIYGSRSNKTKNRISVNTTAKTKDVEYDVDKVLDDLDRMIDELCNDKSQTSMTLD